MQVDSHHFLMFLFYFSDNSFERFTSAASYIKEIAWWEVHIVNKRKVGCDGEEGADEEIIEKGCELPEILQHLLHYYDY